MYRDYAIAPDLFHWESQSIQWAGSPTIRRYEEHVGTGSRASCCLFVSERRSPKPASSRRTCVWDPCDTYPRSGSRPVSFTWELETPMPETVFELARAVAAA